MRTSSVIIKANKAGLKMDAGCSRIIIESDSVEGSFIDENGYAVALRTIRKDEKHEHKPEYDERRDVFHNTLKSFISAFSA